MSRKVIAFRATLKLKDGRTDYIRMTVYEEDLDMVSVDNENTYVPEYMMSAVSDIEFESIYEE